MFYSVSYGGPETREAHDVGRRWARGGADVFISSTAVTRPGTAAAAAGRWATTRADRYTGGCAKRSLAVVRGGRRRAARGLPTRARGWQPGVARLPLAPDHPRGPACGAACPA